MAYVLVAEDNRDVADTLAMLLEIDGHEVHVVDDGVAALAEAERRLPDAAVLDIGLPFLNGIEVAYSLRQQYGDTVRLIACTAYDDDATRSKIAQAGFDVVLTKPAPVGEILDAVASARPTARAFSVGSPTATETATRHREIRLNATRVEVTRVR